MSLVYKMHDFHVTIIIPIIFFILLYLCVSFSILYHYNVSVLEQLRLNRATLGKCC